MKIIINIISWIFNILGILWILLFYFTPLRYIIDFLILGIIIVLSMPILAILSKNKIQILSKYLEKKKCRHEFKRISNCWFHWNHGFSMCIGKCIKCGLEKEIKTLETQL